MGHRIWPGLMAIALIFFVDVAMVAMAEEGDPVLNQPCIGDRVVTGRADPVSTPITILETSLGSSVTLGSSVSIDMEGNFAVSVEPPLVEGQTIIAADAVGRRSEPLAVALPPPSGAGP